ncbi:hypothetical protein ACIBJD_33725 [Kitasatospora sp. NPDC050467]|uniref:hypothetical protein n=1 Tax=Kitasatospora sp. NPDC050467 TaxID=3364053 RepID=UPI0037B46E0E
MADEVGAGPERAPMVWALAVRESAAGAPFAEVIVEVGPRLHGDLIENVVGSGFVLAAGEPPDTTAAVEMRGDRLARLVLVGGRQVWEPASPVVASAGWLSAAEARGGGDRGAAGHVAAWADEPCATGTGRRLHPEAGGSTGGWPGAARHGGR